MAPPAECPLGIEAEFETGEIADPLLAGPVAFASINSSFRPPSPNFQAKSNIFLAGRGGGT